MIESVSEKHAAGPGGLIEILQKTQDTYGYLPEDALRGIAEKTGIPIAKIYGVATFYAQFRRRPAGKYLLLLCMGTACHVNGASRVAEAVSERLGIENGETTADGLFTLNIVACLGCCSLAPVMMVRSKDGEEVHSGLTSEAVVKILDGIAAGAASAEAAK